MTIKVYTDGGSRGNPGKAACAFVIIKDNKTIKQNSKFIGIKTNNEAEYLGIIFALENLGSLVKDKEIELISDSELIIKQLTGKYKIKKPHLKKLEEKIKSIIKQKNLKIKFSNLKRENKFIFIADSLVNQKLDKHK